GFSRFELRNPNLSENHGDHLNPSYTTTWDAIRPYAFTQPRSPFLRSPLRPLRAGLKRLPANLMFQRGVS
ncbi:hypothetical protein FHW96_004975, partial [Novosphingobium sp. SG751A]|uniref:hypothetical protein n=1 Tax=Novosphingobium sp. SG751A TaxID=2587000 RepID=UPI001C12CCB9